VVGAIRNYVRSDHNRVLFLRQGEPATRCWPGGCQSPTARLETTQMLGTRLFGCKTGGSSTSAGAKIEHTGMAGKRLLSNALTVTPALGCTAKLLHEVVAALGARLGCCEAALIACMGEQQPQPTVCAPAGAYTPFAARICAGVC